MNTTSVLVALCLFASGPASAEVRLKAGLATIPGSFNYSTMHAATGTFTEKTEPFRLGATAIRGQVVESFGGGFEGGVEVGGGIPFQKPALDQTVLYEPATGGANILDGDSTVGIVTPVELLATCGWSGKAGPGTAGLSVGAGMMLVFISSRSTDTWWNTPVGPRSVKYTTADSEFAKVTSWSNDSLALPVIEATPAYRLDLGNGCRLGLEAPLGFVGKRSLSGARTAPLWSTAGTQIATPVTEVGGFVWNVLLVYSHGLN